LQFLSTWSRIDSKGKEYIKELLDKGPVREVGMGPIKELDIREREADGKELLCIIKSGPSSLTMW
jgi:hypothetical protein